LASDIMQKRAAYINRNNELHQEFHFAHPESMVKINGIYNSSFYGCVLWNQFGKEMERVEKSWNISMRKMMRLPFNAHRYILEPLSGTKHTIFSFYARLMKFTNKLKASAKSIIRNLFRAIKNDCRSTTGRNLRKIMLITENLTIDDIMEKTIKSLRYYDIPEGSEWCINILKEIQEVKFGELTIPNLNIDELDEIMKYVSSA